MPPIQRSRIPGAIGRTGSPRVPGLSAPGFRGSQDSGRVLLAQLGGAPGDTATDASPPAAIQLSEPRPYSQYPAGLRTVDIPLFDGAPAPADVVQGVLNDCAVLATLMAMAHTDSAGVTHMIARHDAEVHCRDHSDAPGQYPDRAAAYYAVRFRDREVLVSNRLYYTWDRIAYARPSRNCTWMCFVEKAFAVYAGRSDYNTLDYSAGSLSANDVFGRLVGPYNFADLEGGQLIAANGSAQDLTPARLSAFLRAADGLPTIAATGDAAATRDGLQPNHAFTVLSFARDAVSLRNPRGGDSAAFRLSLDDFRTSFVAALQKAEAGG